MQARIENFALPRRERPHLKSGISQDFQESANCPTLRNSVGAVRLAAPIKAYALNFVIRSSSGSTEGKLAESKVEIRYGWFAIL
jgi:hypothetical protein